MRLASYNAHGRTSFGVVIGDGSGDGVVDLRLRGTRHTSVLEVIKAGALSEVAALTKGARADFRIVGCRIAAAGAVAGENPVHRHQPQSRCRI